LGVSRTEMQCFFTYFVFGHCVGRSRPSVRICGQGTRVSAPSVSAVLATWPNLAKPSSFVSTNLRTILGPRIYLSHTSICASLWLGAKDNRSPTRRSPPRASLFNHTRCLPHIRLQRASFMSTHVLYSRIRISWILPGIHNHATLTG
jgi:hypothetical protein